MRVLDLFSGIGGFSLGLERAGMRTVAFCEIDPYCRAVLRKHWPNVHIFDDIRTLTGPDARYWGSNVIDVICGGFPCQDISTAGKGAGIDGERSGLWSEYARLIGEIRPQFVIVENVAALLGRGIERVLGDLSSIGYDSEWNCIPASHVGAPHRRDRVWIVAYPMRGRNGAPETIHQSALDKERNAAPQSKGWPAKPSEVGRDDYVADAEHRGCEGRDEGRQGSEAALPHGTHATHYAALSDGIRRGDASGQWWVEPDVGRVAHGVPSRVDRLRALGNAVVPQIPEIIGRAIMKVHG